MGRQFHAQHIAEVIDVVGQIIVHRQFAIAADRVVAVIAHARADRGAYAKLAVSLIQTQSLVH